MTPSIFREKLDRFYEHNDYKGAYAFLTQALKQADLDQDIAQYLIIANDLLGFLRMRQQNEEAAHLAQTLRKKLPLIQDPLSRANAELNLATFYTALQDISNASYFYEEAKHSYQAMQPLDRKIQASFYNNYSNFLVNTQQYHQALTAQAKAIELITASDDAFIELATSYTNLGLIQDRLGLDGYESYQNAHQLFDQNDPEDPHRLGLYINEGNRAFAIKDYPSALNAYQKAMRLANLLNSPEQIEAVQSDLDYIQDCAYQANIHGMQVATDFFNNIGYPSFKEHFPELVNEVSFGLIGRGSECSGYDDDLSRDHDFGCDFCIFVDDALSDHFEAIDRWYQTLPDSYRGFEKQVQGIEKRRGAIRSLDFYLQYLPCIPSQDIHWLSLDETALNTVTNGRLFNQSETVFTSIRSLLQDYYPRDIWIKKIIGCAARLTQSGQYNYARLMRRKDSFGASLALSGFIEQAIAMLYLLNRRYRPFYKWISRDMKTLSVLPDVGEMIQKLIHHPDPEVWDNPEPINYNDPNIILIETICQAFADELVRLNLSTHHDPFLQTHCAELLNQIESDRIRARHIMED